MAPRAAFRCQRAETQTGGRSGWRGGCCACRACQSTREAHRFRPAGLRGTRAIAVCLRPPREAPNRPRSRPREPPRTYADRRVRPGWAGDAPRLAPRPRPSTAVRDTGTAPRSETRIAWAAIVRSWVIHQGGRESFSVNDCPDNWWVDRKRLPTPPPTYVFAVSARRRDGPKPRRRGVGHRQVVLAQEVAQLGRRHLRRVDEPQFHHVFVRLLRVQFRLVP